MANKYRIMIRCLDTCDEPDGYEPRVSRSFPNETEDAALAIVQAQSLRDRDHATWPELVIER
jgi:hypothetical protein